MAGTTLCVLYFRGARPLYLYFNLPLLKGKVIVVPGKATPINFSITPHRLPFGGALAHFRIVEEGCTEQSAAGGPYWAFRLASQPSDWFADLSVLLTRCFSHLIIPPPPIKNQEVWVKFVNTHKFMGFF